MSAHRRLHSDAESLLFVFIHAEPVEIAEGESVDCIEVFLRGALGVPVRSLLHVPLASKPVQQAERERRLCGRFAGIRRLAVPLHGGNAVRGRALPVETRIRHRHLRT